MKTKLLTLFMLVVLGVISFRIQAQTEAEIVSAMYSGPSDVVELSDDLISYAAHAVWEASVSTSTKTTTGTLTQSANNPDNWTYSASPGDKLVLKFSSGATMSFKFTTVTGYTDGTVDDFIDSHDMAFVSEIPNKLALTISSTTGLNSNTGNTDWSRTISGTAVLEGVSYTVNLNYSGSKHGDIGYSISIYDFSEKISGTINSPKVNFTANESYTSHSAANSGNGTYAQDRWNLNNNTAQTSTITYKFSDAYCKWLSWTSGADSAFSVVNEPYHWDVSGQLLKNNEVYGTVQFDRTIVAGSYGPLLIAKCTNGKDYLLSNLLNPVVNSIKNTGNKSTKANLRQNFPNPFTQMTTIGYHLFTSGKVVLQVFDVLGKKVVTLINKVQPAGSYQVRFDASDLPVGHYFYRLKTNDFVQVRKMILKKP